VHDFEIISGELAAFSEKLAAKPVIVIATKLDATTDRTRLEKLRDFCAAKGLEFHSVSSASGEGIPQLVRAIADALDRLAPVAEEVPEEPAHNENDSPEVAHHAADPPEEN
jgi:GTP-binding protein